MHVVTHIAAQPKPPRPAPLAQLDVYGHPGMSDLTGRSVMEDMRLEVGGEDIEALLPDGIVNEVADYVLGEA